MQLLLAGDLVPTKTNFDLFEKSDTGYILGSELLEIWNSVNVRIFNLEVPLTDISSPISKCGPNLIAPTRTINGIKSLNPSLITLANNHILDQGEQGLRSTIEVLSSNNIPFTGAGENLSGANKPYIITDNGLNIGVYACAESEFSIATEKTAGVNPFDPLESLDHIHQLKHQSDYVIVLYHGGKEHYPYPSPYLQKACRKMVEKGADLIICQHSHCVGCFEKYKDATIVYGQGNFLFDYNNNEFWKYSLLVKVHLENNIRLEYIPIIKKDNVVRLAKQQYNHIIENFHKRSEEILQEGFIEKEYYKFSQINSLSYIRIFSGMNKWLSRIDRFLLNNFISTNRYKKDHLLCIQNFIECEAHRELFLTYLKGENNSVR